MDSPRFRSFLPELVISTIAAVALWAMVDNSLGLWLGGALCATILAPAFALRRRAWIDRVLGVGCASDPVIAVWLISAIVSDVTLYAWFCCSILLYTLAGASAGVALLARGMRLPVTVAPAVAVCASALWLAYPVWGGDSIDRARASMLSRYHPLLAVNGQTAALGVWLEHSLVYRHTVLGQDVPYSLPRSVWPSASLHLLIAAVAATATRFIEPVESPAPSSTDPSATDR